MAILYHTILHYTLHYYTLLCVTKYTLNIFFRFYGKISFKNKPYEPYELYANFYVNA